MGSVALGASLLTERPSLGATAISETVSLLSGALTCHRRDHRHHSCFCCLDQHRYEPWQHLCYHYEFGQEPKGRSAHVENHYQLHVHRCQEAHCCQIHHQRCHPDSIPVLHYQFLLFDSSTIDPVRHQLSISKKKENFILLRIHTRYRAICFNGRAVE